MAVDDQELTSNDSQTTPPTGQAPSGDSSPQPSSPEQTPAKVNLFELPDFRAYQSTVARQQEQQRREYEARIAQLEGRMVQAEEAGLDDFEKAQRQNQRLQQQIYSIQQAEQQRLAQQAEQQRVLEDMQLVSRKTGIPVNDLFKATTLEQAWDMGLEYQRKQLTQSAKQDEDKRNAHMPDMGQGKAPGASSRLEAELAKAETAVDFARILRQAGRGSTRP